MNIDVVITGVNAADTLLHCLESIRAADYTKGDVSIIYVDGGSSDNSVEIAEQFGGVQVVKLETDNPTIGLKRNAGWRAGTSELVQFFDADAVVAPNWWELATLHFRDKVVAIRGRRDEVHPETSSYRWMTDLEWNPPPGRCDAFGGNVLVQRKVLEQMNGYDEVLVGGEDWDLSHRITLVGHSILHLDQLMCKHELSITSPWYYWKAEYRAGYGFTAVAMRHGGKDRKLWISEVERVAIRGGGALALFVLAILWGFWTVLGLFLLLPAAILLLYPRIFNVDTIAANHSLSRSKAVRYAWHCSFVVVPQFCGSVRYFLGRLLHWPLRRKAG